MPRKKKEKTETKPIEKKRKTKKIAEDILEPVLKHKNSNQVTLRQKHHIENLDPKRFELLPDDFSDEAILFIKRHNREKKFDPKKLKILSFGLKAIVFEYSNTISYVVERKPIEDTIQYKLTEIYYDSKMQEYLDNLLFVGTLD
mgnify:CR=1 FL=1